MFYEKCLIPIEVRSITHKTIKVKVFVIINATTKQARGQNKLFQNASLDVFL